MIDRYDPLRAGDMDVIGALFAMRFIPGGSTGLVELYIEDDENYFHKVTFDRLWLADLIALAQSAKKILAPAEPTALVEPVAPAVDLPPATPPEVMSMTADMRTYLLGRITEQREHYTGASYLFANSKGKKTGVSDPRYPYDEDFTRFSDAELLGEFEVICRASGKQYG